MPAGHPGGREPVAGRMILALALASGVFAADQLTKLWAVRQLDPLRPSVLIPGFAQLTLVMNPGVAFGLFAGIPPSWRWLVMVLSVAALILLCALASRIVPDGGWLGRVAVGLVSGGATGNLLDRWRLGAVVDFVDIHWRDYHWPAFNVADSAITVGVVLLATELTLSGRRGVGRDAPSR